MEKVEKRQIWVNTGIEGHPHDPYSFLEFVVLKNDKKITLHQGLLTWIAIDNEKVVDLVEEAAEKMFTEITGFTIQGFIDTYEYMKTKCPHCGCMMPREYQMGYPGETIEICGSCKKVCDTTFDESAII